MKAIDAAAIVLKDANGPLHSREITERMLERKLWTTEGRTPWDTVRAQLAEDISVAGSASRFVRDGPGVFALSASAAADSLSVTDTAESEQENERSQLDEEADSLSFTDAAERVLKHSADQQPLHYSEITKRARKRGLISTKGRTPAATMNSGIVTEIHRNKDPAIRLASLDTAPACSAWLRGYPSGWPSLSRKRTEKSGSRCSTAPVPLPRLILKTSSGNSLWRWDLPTSK